MVKLSSHNSDRILWSGKPINVKKLSIKSKLISFMIILLIFITGCLFYVWSRIQVIDIGYKISNEIARGKRLAEENKKLRLEIAILKSYSRIEKIASQEFKMVEPNPNQVIVIR